MERWYDIILIQDSVCMLDYWHGVTFIRLEQVLCVETFMQILVESSDLTHSAMSPARSWKEIFIRDINNPKLFPVKKFC